MYQRRISVAAFALLGACLTAGCENWAPDELLGLKAEPESVPTATPTPTPEPAATPGPTATPQPELGQQLVRGHAVLHISGINKLPLRTTLDSIIAATFTWELEGADKRVPIAEISIRGVRNRPCLKRPCGDDAGLVVRVTANANYDGGQPDESKHCGSGVNYYYRLALGNLGKDGGIDVVLDWDASGLRASTPVDTVFIKTKIPSSFGFGRFLEGAPFSHGERGFGWNTLSIDNLGGHTVLREFYGDPGKRNHCP